MKKWFVYLAVLNLIISNSMATPPEEDDQKNKAEQRSPVGRRIDIGSANYKFPLSPEATQRLIESGREAAAFSRQVMERRSHPNSHALFFVQLRQEREALFSMLFNEPASVSASTRPSADSQQGPDIEAKRAKK